MSTSGNRRVARAEQRDQGERNCDPFSETLAPLVGLGDEECGKEETEVDQNAVGLDHAQLDRPRPEGRECGEKRQAQNQPTRPVERPAERRPRSARRAPASRRPRAIPPGRRCAGRSGRSPRRPGPGRRSGRAERSAPLIPLTLRAMHGTRRHRARARPGRLRASFSACSAGICLLSGSGSGSDTDGIQYETTSQPYRRHQHTHDPIRNSQAKPSAPQGGPSATTARIGWSLRSEASSRLGGGAAIQARAAVAAAARVAQAMARPAARHSRRRRISSTSTAAGTIRTRVRQRRRLLAAGADPDRGRRARGDLDRRSYRASGASAAAPAPPSPPKAS